MNFCEVNFNSEKHLKCIWILAKKNNFHAGDLYAVLYGKVYLPSVINILPKSIINNMSKKMEEFAKSKMYKNDSNYKGLFICKEKKPVGFILYYSRNNVQGVVDLLFLLIDEKQRENGYGSLLLRKYHKKLKNDGDRLIIVRIDDESAGKWYKKFGYSDEDLKSGHPDLRLLQILEPSINPCPEKKLFYLLN